MITVKSRNPIRTVNINVKPQESFSYGVGDKIINAAINKIAKENSIPSIEIQKWFDWIEALYFYILVKREIYQIEKEIQLKEEKFDQDTKYMIIKKPTIEKK
jgi:hypothetical protein